MRWISTDLITWKGALKILLPSCLLLFSVLAWAQSGGAYDLSWNTIAGGGSVSNICDGTVNFEDFALFADHWLEVDCNDSNHCDGADLDDSNDVDWPDVSELAGYWLACDPEDWALDPNDDWPRWVWDGTIGEVSTGPPEMLTGGPYTLRSGFLAGVD
jgi:hypothetical protein